MSFVDDFINKRYVLPQVEPIKGELEKSQEELKVLKVEKELNANIYQLKYREAPDLKATDFLKQYKEWVFANVNVIAKGVAKIKPRLYRLKKNEEIEEIKEHELLELLYRVNSYMTKADIIHSTISHEYLAGDSPWYLARKNRDNPKEKPQEIWPLRPDWLFIKQGKIDKGEFIAFYEYKIPGQETQIFLPHEILLFKKDNPETPYRGMGVVKAAALTIDIDNFATNWNRNFFWNSARPDAVLSTEQQLSQDVIQRLKNQIRSEYGGISNSLKLMILENGLDYKPFQSTVKDMDFLEQQRWNRDKIMALFGNTKTALGIVDDVNRSNAEASEYVHTRDTIKPEMERFVDTLNEFLVPLYGDDLFLSFVDPVPENQELKVSKYEKGHNKWLTTNEIREEEGLNPIDGGDIIYMPISLIPIGNGETPKEGKHFIKLEAKNIKSRLPKLDFSEEIQRLKNKNLRIRRLRIEFKKHKKEIEEEIKALLIKRRKRIKAEKRKETFWKSLIKDSDVYEKRVIKIFKDEIYPYLSNSTQHNIKSFKKKSIGDWMFNEDDAITFSIRQFEGLFQELVKTQGDKAYEYLGINRRFNIDQAIADKLNKNINKFSKSYLDTAKDKLKKSLKEGIDNGESLPDLTRRVKNVFDDLEKYQALRIAETEVSRATNFANSEVWKETGVEKEEWFTALDEKVCPDCESMEGKVVGIRDNYFNKGDKLPISDTEITYEDIERPPLHVSCRCTTVPVIDESKIADFIRKIRKNKEKEKIRKKKNIDDLIEIAEEVLNE